MVKSMLLTAVGISMFRQKMNLHQRKDVYKRQGSMYEKLYEWLQNNKDSMEEIHKRLDEIEQIHELYSPVKLGLAAALALVIPTHS